MRGRYHPFFLARDYQEQVVAKNKCQLDGPEPFKPLFGVYDFPSEGFRTTARSWVNKGLVELMSEPEYATFLYLEFDPIADRIATQCALDPAETQLIAREIGTEHPTVVEGPIIMSTDFVLDERKGGVRSRRAISVKREVDLTERVLEKADIECEYWKRRSVPWSFLLDTQLPEVLVANARLVQPRILESQLPCGGGEVALIGSWLTPHIETGILAFGTLCRRCDEAIGVPLGTSFAVGLHLVARRHWPVDMSRPIAGHLPMPLLSNFLVSE